MKILTKDWAERYESIRFICKLEQVNSSKSYEELQEVCHQNYLDYLKSDEDMCAVLSNPSVVQKLYEEKLKRNANTVNVLPKNLLAKLKRKEIISLGFVVEQDKKILSAYFKKAIKEIENASKKASRITECAVDCLSQSIEMDELVGALVEGIYVDGNDLLINFDDKTLLIKDYKILEREDFKVYEWEEDNPLTCWTCITAVELHSNKSNTFELHLMILNGDENENTKNYYFTLGCTDVRLV